MNNLKNLDEHLPRNEIAIDLNFNGNSSVNSYSLIPYPSYMNIAQIGVNNYLRPSDAYAPIN